jgi:hypothetical protein
MIHGGPLGAGVRRPLPSCCISAIREMLPSEMNVGAPILEVESNFRLLEKGLDRIKGLSLAEVPNSVFAESGETQRTGLPP